MTTNPRITVAGSTISEMRVAAREAFALLFEVPLTHVVVTMDECEALHVTLHNTVLAWQSTWSGSVKA